MKFLWICRPWCWLLGHKWTGWYNDTLIFVIVPVPIKRNTCWRCGKHKIDIGF